MWNSSEQGAVSIAALAYSAAGLPHAQLYLSDAVRAFLFLPDA